MEIAVNDISWDDKHLVQGMVLVYSKSRANSPVVLGHVEQVDLELLGCEPREDVVKDVEVPLPRTLRHHTGLL